MVQQLNSDQQYLEYPIDALEKQRRADVEQVENTLKSHDIMGVFFTRYWEQMKNFVRVETYHQDILFLKHEGFSRKIFILLEGEVSAYILTDKTPKPITVYDFAQYSVLTELSALLGGRRHYGFMAMTDCKLVSLDLEYIEDEIEIFDIYTELMEVLYNESGKRTAEICNIALVQKLDLKDMLVKHNLFADINELAESELNKLADNMRYVFLPNNEVLIDEINNKNIYLIEGGTVTQTKVYKELAESDSYLYTRNLNSVYINDQQNNLQEVFAAQMGLENKLNLQSDFDCALEGKKIDYKIVAGTETELEPVYKTIHITEEIFRHGIVGEDLLAKHNNIKVTAHTKTACCLIEINVDKLAINQKGIISQLIGFFNNKTNDMQTKVVAKQRQEINVKNKYIAFVNFSFMFMVIMAVLGLFGNTHQFLDLSSKGALLHHIVVMALICFLSARLLKPLNFMIEDFGLTTKNLKLGLIQALMGIVFMLCVATGLKEIYIIFHAHQYGLKLFQPELVSNENLTAFGFYIVVLLCIVYIFIYELCARGIIQNIFSLILSNSKIQYWGSIFAAATVASQFHMSLFHEFSMVFFASNIVAGVIFANTRNLWAVFVFHTVFSLYILTVLGL